MLCVDSATSASLRFLTTSSRPTISPIADDATRDQLGARYVRSSLRSTPATQRLAQGAHHFFRYFFKNANIAFSACSACLPRKP